MGTVSLKSHGTDYCLSLFATYCLQTIQKIRKLKSKETAKKGRRVAQRETNL
jgi:hypothetical protein